MSGSNGASTQKNMRNHILEVAKDYCAENGLEQASVRAIADRAQVNSAMLRYYFGNKDSLMRTIISSAADVLGENRFSALEKLVEENGDAVPLKDILYAYAEPVLLPGHDLEREVRLYYYFLTLTLADATGSLVEHAREEFADIQNAFLKQINRAAPHIRNDMHKVRFTMMRGALWFLKIEQEWRMKTSGASANIRQTKAVLERFSTDWASVFSTP